MRIEANIPDHAQLLEAILEGFVQAAMVEIESGVVPPYPWEAPVRYQAEPDGRELWQLPHETMELGEGDCEDLCLWTAAGYRVTGEDPGARCRLMQMSAASQIHCVVERGDGDLEDPSARQRYYTISGAIVTDHRGQATDSPAGASAPKAASYGGTPNPFAGIRAAATAVQQWGGSYRPGDSIYVRYGGPDEDQPVKGSLAYNMMQGQAVAPDLTDVAPQMQVKLYAMQHALDLGEPGAAAKGPAAWGAGTRTQATQEDLFNAGMVDSMGNPVLGPGGQPTGAMPFDGQGSPYGPYGGMPGMDQYGMYGGYGGYGMPGMDQYGMYGGYGMQGMYGGIPYMPDEYPDSPYGWQGGSQGLVTYADIDDDDFGYGGQDVLELLGG